MSGQSRADFVKFRIVQIMSAARLALRYSATRCRIVEYAQVVTLSTRHVPAGPYVGVLPLR